MINGVLDESGRSVHSRKNLDVLRFENRRHFCQGFLDRLGNLHRVGAVLTEQLHQHAGPALDQYVSKFQFRRCGDMRDIFETNDVPGTPAQNHLAQLVGIKRLSFRLHRDALIIGFHESRTARASGLTRGRKQLIKGHIQRHHPIRIDLNLQLSNFTTHDAD